MSSRMPPIAGGLSRSRSRVENDDAHFSSPAESASARASSTCSKRGGGSASRLAICSSSVPCPKLPGRSRLISKRSSRWGGFHTRRCPPVLRQADVFVFPSLFEGSAVVTYEALASGLPSVVTAEAGSVVRDGVEGFVVGARDVAALAARMETLGRDRELRARMAARRPRPLWHSTGRGTTAPLPRSSPT